MILPREALEFIKLMGEVCKRDDPFYEAPKIRGVLHSATHLYLQAHPTDAMGVEEMYVTMHEAFERGYSPAKFVVCNNASVHLFQIFRYRSEVQGLIERISSLEATIANERNANAQMFSGVTDELRKIIEDQKATIAQLQAPVSDEEISEFECSYGETLRRRSVAVALSEFIAARAQEKP
jgi:hypothetical protein